MTDTANTAAEDTVAAEVDIVVVIDDVDAFGEAEGDQIAIHTQEGTNAAGNDLRIVTSLDEDEHGNEVASITRTETAENGDTVVTVRTVVTNPETGAWTATNENGEVIETYAGDDDLGDDAAEAVAGDEVGDTAAA